MRVAVIYVCVTHGSKTADFCARFAATWNAFPPGADCNLIVACQGGPLATETALLFASLNASFWPHANTEARDLGAYLDAAKSISSDYEMMLCLGESVHFHREGWLQRLVEARERYGPGMYGPLATHVIRAHLQTTAFFCPPSFLREYPLKVTDKASRYQFEHGERALWRRLHARNIPVKLVTFDGEWSPGQWRLPQNCLWRGDQSNCLMWANHTENFAKADETRKRNWSASADRPFK
jgi:hypothetical protein